MAKELPQKPCPSCAPLQAKLDAFIMFLCAPVSKCQTCGLIATDLVSVTHKFLGRSEHLCCKACTPGAAKIDGAKIESAPIGDAAFQARAKEANALVSEARSDAR